MATEVEVALPLYACLDLVFHLSALNSELVGFWGDLLLGCGESFGVCQELLIYVLTVALFQVSCLLSALLLSVAGRRVFSPLY